MKVAAISKTANEQLAATARLHSLHVTEPERFAPKDQLNLVHVGYKPWRKFGEDQSRLSGVRSDVDRRRGDSTLKEFEIQSVDAPRRAIRATDLSCTKRIPLLV